VIWTFESTVKAAAAVPLKATVLTRWNHCPLIVTLVPTGPHAGVNPLIAGTFEGGADMTAPGRLTSAPSATMTESRTRASRLRGLCAVTPTSSRPNLTTFAGSFLTPESALVPFCAASFALPTKS
jgi:hypothetical protein